jgi:hypothetical protein
MKKIFVVFLAVLIPALAAAQSQGQLRGLIRGVNGTVEVKQNAASPWIPAAVGMNLDKNASISTGLKSSALISLGDSVITIRPLSRVRLDELAASRETADVALFLRAGRVHAQVKAPVGGGTVNFQVRSPSATASVRGTEFVMDPAKINMSSGIVSFAGSDGLPALVNAGQSASAGPGGVQVSSDLSPALPPGSRSVQQTGSAAPADGKITGRVGWYGGE